MKNLFLLFTIFLISCASKPKYESADMVVLFKANEITKEIEPCKGYIKGEVPKLSSNVIELEKSSLYLIDEDQIKTVILPVDYNKGIDVSERCDGLEHLYLQQGFFKKEPAAK